jgi:hypothetical protein
MAISRYVDMRMLILCLFILTLCQDTAAQNVISDDEDCLIKLFRQYRFKVPVPMPEINHSVRLSTGHRLIPKEFANQPLDVQFAPEGTHYFFEFMDEEEEEFLGIYDTLQLRITGTIKLGPETLAVRFIPGKQQIWVARTDSHRFYDFKGTKISDFKPKVAPVDNVMTSISWDSSRVAIAGTHTRSGRKEGIANVYEKGELVGSIEFGCGEDPKCIKYFGFSRHHKNRLLVATDSEVMVLDVKKEVIRCRFSLFHKNVKPTKYVTWLAYSKDEKRLAISLDARETGRIFFVDVESGKVLPKYDVELKPDAAVGPMTFDESGDRLYVLDAEEFNVLDRYYYDDRAKTSTFRFPDAPGVLPFRVLGPFSRFKTGFFSGWEWGGT